MDYLNEQIAEAATSWSPAYPGKKDVPRNIAKICRAAMGLARNRQCEPVKCIEGACEVSDVVGVKEVLWQLNTQKS